MMMPMHMTKGINDETDDEVNKNKDTHWQWRWWCHDDNNDDENDDENDRIVDQGIGKTKSCLLRRQKVAWRWFLMIGVYPLSMTKPDVCGLLRSCSFVAFFTSPFISFHIFHFASVSPKTKPFNLLFYFCQFLCMCFHSPSFYFMIFFLSSCCCFTASPFCPGYSELVSNHFLMTKKA